MTFDSLTSPELLLPAALAVLGLLALVNLGLLLALLRSFRRYREEQELWRRRIGKQVALNDPMRAAIAAVMAVRREGMTFELLEREIATLMRSWDQIETLADDAHRRLGELVDRAERDSDKESAGTPRQES